MFMWMTVGALDGSGHEVKGLNVVWTHRLMCDRRMGGEGLRRRRGVVCRWTIDRPEKLSECGLLSPMSHVRRGTFPLLTLLYSLCG